MSLWNMPKTDRKTSLSASLQPTEDPEPAELHLLPTLWFRNDWALVDCRVKSSAEETTPAADQSSGGHECRCSDAPAAGRNRSFPAKATYRCSSPKTKQTTSGFSRAKRTRAAT